MFVVLLAAILVLPAVSDQALLLQAASGSGKYGDGDRDDDRDDDRSGSDSDRDRDDDRDDHDRSGSDDRIISTSGSNSSFDDSSSNSRSSSDDNSTSSSSTDGNQTTVTRSTRERIEGKTRAIIDGFQAEFSVRLEHRFDRTKFRAEVSNLNRPAGSTYEVCFASASLGDIVLNSLRFGELELDSRRGQAIPNFVEGELIELHQGSCGGALVMAASLGSAPATGIPAPGTTTTTSSNPTTTQTDSRIEGKARSLINGFQAEFNVRYEVRPDRTKFRAEAESLNLGAGTRLDVCRAGAFLGDILLNSFNYGELERDSRFVNVPVFQRGETIDLRLGGCDGQLVMAATFGGGTVVQPGAPQQEIEGKTRRVTEGFEAEFQVRFEQLFDRRKIRAEASNLNLPEQTRLSVCFGTQALGEIVLNALHFGELELDSRLGHTVPTLQLSDVIDLRAGLCSDATAPLMSVLLNQVR